jgi:hypothetical protein
MVVAVESDGRSGPVEEGWCGWLDGIDLSTFQLALALGVIGRGPPKIMKQLLTTGKSSSFSLSSPLSSSGLLLGSPFPWAPPEK